MGDIHDDLREVMGLLGKATPGPWSAWYSGRGNTRFRHVSATAPAIPGFCGERPIYIANLAVISEETDAANAALIVAAVNLLKEHGPALLARQEGEDARDGARYRWLKANFQADYCRSTSDYWRITGEHDTPQELHIGNGELTLDYLVDAARSGGGG